MAPRSPINHFGVLVPDLDEAIEQWQALLGVRFRPPFVASFPRVECGEEVEEPGELSLTYSVEGPPHVELMEATGTGVWRAELGFGLHHVGGYVPDVEAERRRLADLGATPEADVRAPDGRLMLTYLRPSDPPGPLLELLTEAMYGPWAAWVAGGPPPGG
jgi:catechol 2,3-dioxygenase-like lactoylglutathione lyase family enzyme